MKRIEGYVYPDGGYVIHRVLGAYSAWFSPKGELQAVKPMCDNGQGRPKDVVPKSVWDGIVRALTV